MGSAEASRSGLLAILILAMSSGAAGQDAQRDSLADPEIVIPAGTVLAVSMTTYINTRSSQVGDSFYAETIHPIWMNQHLVIPAGSTIRGTVTEVIRPGKIKGRGRVAIRIDNVVLPNGVSRNLIASFRGIHGPGAEKLDRSRESVEMDSSKGGDVGVLAGTTTQGTIIGALVDHNHGTGAAIGAGAGAAAGLATILFTRGPDLVLAPGTEFELELKQPVRFAYGEIGVGADQPYTPRRYLNRQRPDRQVRPPSFTSGLRYLIPWFGPWF